MLCSAWAAALAADGDSFTYAGLTYNIISEADHTCEVGENRTIEGEIVIPEQVQNGEQLYTVIRLGKRAFYWNRKITAIQLPSTLTTIGQEALMRADYITELVIPNSVTSIETRGVYGCERLASLTLGTGLTEIVSETFSGCIALEAINIPDNITSVATCSFNFCNGVKTINFGRGLRTIGVNAFSGLTSLEAVSIPANVTSIANQAFTECSKLKTVTLEPGTTTLSLGESVFGDANWITGATMPSVAPLVNVNIYRKYTCTSTDIDALPFSRKVKLENVVIGRDVNTVAANTFAGSTAIVSVTSQSTTPPSLIQSAFDADTYSQAILSVPTEAVAAYEANQNWRRFSTIRGVEIAPDPVDPDEPDEPGDPDTPDNPDDPANLDDFQIWFDPASITLNINQTAQLILKSNRDEPVEVDGSNDRYTTSDEAVATVSKYGELYGIGPGKCTITLVLKLYLDTKEYEKTAKCEIEVLPDDAAVEAINADDNATSCYSITGIRTAKPHRGIFIINGHKVLISK